MTYTKEQLQAVVGGIEGKTVKSLEYVEDPKTGPYWCAKLDNGAEFCFRFMNEVAWWTRG